MDEFVRGFRSQGRICRCHRKDVKIDIEIKRGRFCPPVRAALGTSVCGKGSSESVRKYVRTLRERLGSSWKDPDCFDPNGCIEPDGGQARTPRWFENAPFQQHSGRPWPRERVCSLGNREYRRPSRLDQAKLHWAHVALRLSQVPLPSPSPLTRFCS